jgi:hypothetical protein
VSVLNLGSGVIRASHLFSPKIFFSFHENMAGHHLQWTESSR